MVPKGAKAGDLIAAKDDQGHDVRVRVPVGAVKGVHLCVCVCVFARAVCEYSGSTQVLACTLHPLLIPCIVVCFCAHTHAHTYGHVCSTCVCVCVCVCTRVCTGTLLRVPVGLNVDAAQQLSDPRDLERILREVVEVPGRENVYRYAYAYVCLCVYVRIQEAHVHFLCVSP
jgi:hypothetical protein